MAQTNRKLSVDEELLRSFIWAVYNFFSTCTDEEPTIETPYLFDVVTHKDYTGTIGISGSHKGSIFLTFEKDLIVTLLESHFEEYDNKFEDEHMEKYRADYMGEITNFIAGNVRKHLGKEFLISVPVVLSEPDKVISLSQKGCGIVFPFKWKKHKSILVLNIQADQDEVGKLLKSF